MRNFGLIGVAGFVAPRHLKAIRDTGNRLVAATDPHDSVGILDQVSWEVRYFPEIERFDRHLEKLRFGPEENRVHYVSICSPNYLHDAHVRLALRVGASAICEKPLVINAWNLDQLEHVERESSGRVYTVLQLRLHPALARLRGQLEARRDGSRAIVDLAYVTGRGNWYLASWKGNEERSGGIIANIGVHFLDMLLWLFGPADELEVHHRETTSAAGYLGLRGAEVRWFLSIDPADLPAMAPGQTTYRSITIDGEEVELSQGFSDLHTRVYEEILAGRGWGIADARPSIELMYRIRTAAIRSGGDREHPLLRRAGPGATGERR